MRGKSDNKGWYVIIMAGGRGERFWPVSREKTPKQLITLLGKRSFLQQAVDRVLPVVPGDCLMPRVWGKSIVFGLPLAAVDACYRVTT